MSHKVLRYVQKLLINRNMRCIEILLKRVLWGYVRKINRNMRCIEIKEEIAQLTEKLGINRNMRCIEILFREIQCLHTYG